MHENALVALPRKAEAPTSVLRLMGRTTEIGGGDVGALHGPSRLRMHADGAVGSGRTGRRGDVRDARDDDDRPDRPGPVRDGAGGVTAPAPILKSVADCQRYVDRIVGSDWWSSRSAIRRVPVDDGRGRRGAWARWDGKIVLPRWARTESTILHELAHHLAGLDANHGPKWRAAYVALTRRFGQPGSAERLIAGFDAKPRQRWRGYAPKVIREPRRETCATCGRSARRMTWLVRTSSAAWPVVRYCTRRCAEQDFRARLRRADPGV